MRRFDKTKNILKANLLAESRYLESKGLINEVYDRINLGDIVMNGDRILKVTRSPYTRVDNGNSTAYIDDRMVFTAIDVEDIDTGKKYYGDITNYKKINPEDIDNIKQGIADRKAKEKERDDAFRERNAALAAKLQKDKEDAERERIKSQGDIELPKVIIDHWESGMGDLDYEISSYKDLGIECQVWVDEDNFYDVHLDIDFEQAKSSRVYREDDLELEFNLDMVYITKDEKDLYQGRAEFLELFTKKIAPWIHSNSDLNWKAEKAFIEHLKDY